jgi:hypothetical protein
MYQIPPEIRIIFSEDWARILRAKVQRGAKSSAEILERCLAITVILPQTTFLRHRELARQYHLPVRQILATTAHNFLLHRLRVALLSDLTWDLEAINRARHLPTIRAELAIRGPVRKAVKRRMDRLLTAKFLMVNLLTVDSRLMALDISM